MADPACAEPMTANNPSAARVVVAFIVRLRAGTPLGTIVRDTGGKLT